MKIVHDPKSTWHYMNEQQTYAVTGDDGVHIASGTTAEEAAIRAAVKLAENDRRVKAVSARMETVRRSVITEIAAKLLADPVEETKGL